MNRLRLLFLTLTVGLTLPALGGTETFEADSFAIIRARHAGEEALVLIWSVSCTHCKHDMRRVAERLGAHSNLRAVMIAVDPPEIRDDVLQTIADLGVGAAEHWQFGTDAPARLRASIDPAWFGEVPRSYLVTADGSLHGFSGRLPEAVLDQWSASSR
jgi:hypothetical protein